MKKRNVKAFTVVELVIVIAVVAVLAAVMIPTFGALVEKANISADEAEITSLNTQLAINEVENADDLYALIKETYGEAKANNFAPRSAKYGLSYYYDVEKNQIVLSTYSDLDATPQNSPEAENKTANKVILLGATTEQAEPDVNETTRNSLFYDAHKDDIRMHKDRYFCLDLSGIIGDMLVAMESGDTTAIEAAKEVLTEAAQAFNKAAEHFQAIADALDLRLGELAKLESFTVTADKGISAGDTIYVPYDVKTFTLTAGGFVSDNGGELGEVTVTWGSSNALATVDESGKVTLALPAVGADSEVVITATATVGESEPKSLTKTIAIVRINAVTLDTEFGSIELDNAGDVLASTITYDGTKDSYSLGSISAYSYNYTIEGIELDDTLSFELGEGNVFTIDGNNLVLTKEEFGTQNLTIKVGEYITDTVAIEVVDNSSSPFEVNDITEDVKMGATYLFRVGNGNAFTLDKLFNTEKAPDSITLNIFDASKTSGTGTLNAIATSGSGFTATYTSDLTKDTWASSTIKFSGTGVAIIEVTTEQGTATLAVEVVNGKNVTSASDFSGATNYVLLNDITWGTANKTAISGTIYGNGFAINAQSFTSATTNSNNALFYLNGGTIDNVVINGPVYPELIYQSEVSSSKPYYVAGIYTTGNATISNSYISGFREPVMANGTSLYVENTTLVGGNYCNLWLQTGSLTLKDVTTVQVPTTATIGSGTVLGAGVIVESGISNTCDVTLEGTLNQYNWVSESDKQYLDSDIQSIASNLVNNSSLYHEVGGTKYINTGILFLGTRTKAVNDNRTNKASVPYSTTDASVKVMGETYDATIYTHIPSPAVSAIPSYDNSYVPNTQAVLKPVFKHNLTLTNGVVQYKIDIPAGETCTLDASVYTVSKYSGQTIAVNISCTGGTVNGKKVTFNKAGTYTLTYVVTDNWFFNNDGSKQTANNEYTYEVTVVVSNSNHPSAVINVDGLTKTSKWVESGSVFDKDYSAYYEVLGGLVITDYNDDGTSFTVSISASNLNGLSIKASDSEVTGTQVDGTNYWMYDSKADDDSTDKTVTFTYSYTGKNGTTVKNTATFTLAKKNSCVTPDTLVTLADGTQKEIQYVTYEDMLLVWNFYDGKYDVVPASAIGNHGVAEQIVTALYFDDGTVINIIGEHGIFDADLGEFVFLNAENAKDYVGHNFIRAGESGLSKVKMVDCHSEIQVTDSYSVLSDKHYNCFLEGMLTLTPTEGLGNFYMPFDVTQDMAFDKVQMQTDIELYGLYTYADLADIMTEDEFVALNAQYFKVAVSKGIITYDDLVYFLEKMLAFKNGLWK
ncbi:MAG: hypothetical protein IJD74_05295 [Clostridia bacterium]|nr:hypothetical protein [Clostridia bacterium]